jgi:hypothetical protein
MRPFRYRLAAYAFVFAFSHADYFKIAVIFLLIFASAKSLTKAVRQPTERLPEWTPPIAIAIKTDGMSGKTTTGRNVSPGSRRDKDCVCFLSCFSAASRVVNRQHRSEARTAKYTRL